MPRTDRQEDRDGGTGSAAVKPRMFRSRAAAAAFGALLLASGLVSGLFASMVPLRWILGSPAFDWTALVILLVFAPMTVILLGAASAMFRYARMGVAGRLVQRGPVQIFAAITAALIVAGIIASLLQLTLDGLGAAIEGIACLALMHHFYRAAPQIEAFDRTAAEATSESDQSC